MDARLDERDPSGNLSVAKSAPFNFGWGHDPPAPFGKSPKLSHFFLGAAALR